MENDTLKIDIITNSSPNIKMTITHIPSGLFVSGEGTKIFLLKDQLLEELGDRLKETRRYSNS